MIFIKEGLLSHHLEIKLLSIELLIYVAEREKVTKYLTFFSKSHWMELIIIMVIY